MRILYIVISIFALMLPVWPPSRVSAAVITEYKAVFVPFRVADKHIVFAIRSFKRDGRSAHLVVDADSFETFILDGTLDDSSAVTQVDWEATSFIKALSRYTAPVAAMANQGLIKAQTDAKGVFVTIDMCPSRRPFEKSFFEKTAALGLTGRPTPVAVMITGAWMRKHNEEFRWLASEHKVGRLDITWVNHSYSHPYNSGAPLDENFLLAPGVDFDDEVLSTERLLLEAGLMPSVFFRYPGLISSPALQGRLRKLSLIPIGANAWLAKGEAAIAGSIILVHGNGNEPSGIKAALSFYSGNIDKIKGDGLRLMGLREAFVKEG